MSWKSILQRITVRLAAVVTSVITLWWVFTGVEFDYETALKIAEALLLLIGLFPNTVKSLGIWKKIKSMFS